ncbi:hypothetical protein BEP19_11720 [Ammoniphilus oxalaticus]|uniref:Peptidase M23 n=1 Tax=Ammoniphilus oxalaticus TaxID=66863 RepID=A0A419SGI3_9BACL|nr:M23 family metallopeptidase [Ammoniphilus oxalaticus]RKD22897.1 hypothetical protein BEP19_11720 [Ammoniphilus oxalaticus]
MERLKKAKAWLSNQLRRGVTFAKLNKGKTAAILVTAPLFITGTTLASHYYNANSTTLYYVYVDGEEVGAVDDPNRVHSYIQQEIARQREKQIKPKVASELKFKEASSLKEKPNTTETLKLLEREIKFSAAAKSLSIDGKIAGYVSDQQDVSALLNEVKGKYGPLPEADEEATTVVDFKEDVKIKNDEVSPRKVITAEQLKTLIEDGTLEQVTHTVTEGDTLSMIAEQYDIKTKDIIRMNPELTEESLLQLGQNINVTAAKPLLTVRKVEKIKEKIVLDYSLEVEMNEEMYRGDSRVIQAGQEGLKEITYEIVEENGLEIEKKVIDEQIISEPISKIMQRGTKVKPDRGSGSFLWPTNGGRISSVYGQRWGRMHKGIDIAGVSDRTIKAADNGRVASAGWNGNYGNCVIIDHGNGYRTLYGHLSSIDVSVGHVVERGEKVGVMGSTGHSTGVHLHFEVIQNGSHRNPLDFVHR